MIAQFGPANPFVSFGQYRGVLGRMVEAAGFKDSAEFFKPISPEQDQQLSNPAPQEPQMPPEVQAYMAKTQAEIQGQQAKFQADMQMQQAKMQADLEFERQKAALELQLQRDKAAAEIQLMREKEASKLQIEREKMNMHFAMKEQEFQAEAQLKAMKVGAGITANVEIPG
jgi:cytochrome c biogenesis protein ResB